MFQTTKAYSAEAVREGIIRNDRAVIEWFYGRLRRRAFGLLCRAPQGSPACLAMEDCFNPAFLILLRKVREGHFRGGNLMAYALMVVRHCYCDEQKKERRRRWQELSAAGEPPAAPSAACRTAAEVFEREGHVRLLQWYRSLDERLQRLLDLRLQGYNHYEIAERLPLAAGSVRNRFSKLMREAQGVAGSRRRTG